MLIVTELGDEGGKYGRNGYRKQKQQNVAMVICVLAVSEERKRRDGVHVKSK